jgi:hypothetical protein
MKNIIAVAIVAWTGSGCVHTPIYYKDGATQQEFVQDKYNCEKDARQSGYYGAGIAGAMNMRHFFNECMNAQGWYARN